eukprot:contig_22905_g5657
MVVLTRMMVRTRFRLGACRFYDDPAENFTLFLEHFYADYKLKRFSVSDVYAETRRLTVARANRGTRRDVVVLLVDEIAKLRTGVADDLCEVLGLDINSCIRSECCTLSDAGSRLGLTCCTAMESSLMLAERSASGRPAEPLDRIPPGSVQAQTLRLLDAMRLSAGGDSGVNWQQTGAWRDVVRPDADFMAIALVMMGGVVWRSAELLAIELQQSMHGSVQKMLDRVERKLVVDSNGKDLGFTSLWSKENAVVRDHVLAATFLAEDVSESSLVVDVEDSDELPVKNKDKADPSDLDKMKLTRMEVLARRDKAATEVWKQFKNPALDGLTWGNAVFLGLPFAWTPLLHKVLVDATVASSGVVFLAGAGEKEQDPLSITLDDLLAGHADEDEMLWTVYKLRKGAASVDGVCFYRALNDVPGVATCGELVAVFIQAKHSIPTATTSVGKKDVEEPLS